MDGAKDNYSYWIQKKKDSQCLKSSFSVVGGRVDSLLTNNNEKVVRLESG